MNITIEDARIICAMEEVCWSEGIGPDNNDLMKRISTDFPELVQEFSFLPWERLLK